MSAENAPSGGSLADRISKPDPPSGTSWADEVNSPADANPPSIPGDGKEANSDDVSKSQTDGASGPFGGGELHEPDYNVEIKLADMQADPNNPLFSATTFEQLGL
jgi:ATP-dependent RNA helicase DDX19/DBP5